MYTLKLVTEIRDSTDGRPASYLVDANTVRACGLHPRRAEGEANDERPAMGEASAWGAGDDCSSALLNANARQRSRYAS